jgi:hypothetical protein
MSQTSIQSQLLEFRPDHQFFVGVDSDGCMFDSMEIKHKECFIPSFIQHFHLQNISRYAREVWEFVNLYSKTRGLNRFPALRLALDLLRDHPRVQEKSVTIPLVSGLNHWVETSTSFSMTSLDMQIAKDSSPDLVQIRDWSSDVNQRIKTMVWGLRPFTHGKTFLEMASTQADIMVVSQTDRVTLNREWQQAEILTHTKLVAGQEMGSKAEQLDLATKNKYPPSRILMIGDAPGDLEAAVKTGALFFPIIPGREEECWNELITRGFQKFLTGSYEGSYQNRYIKEFQAMLPDHPTWFHKADT